MEFSYCSINYGHKPGDFCRRMAYDKHFISFFRTDFLYEKNGKLLRGHSGDMLIIPSGEIIWHGPTPEMTEGFANDWMRVDGDDFIDLIRKYKLPIGTSFSVGGRHTLAHCIEKIKAEQAACSPGYMELCELYMREAVIKLHRAHKNVLSGKSDEKIKNLRISMIEEPQRDWTLKTMAEHCGYSQSHFSTLYNEMYSISPVSDLINIRLENSKMMLAYSSVSISEICDAVGFSNIYYFSKCFKNNIGISPSQYRKQFVKSINDE